MDNSGVVEVVDRPQSQQVLSTRWVSKQRLDRSYKSETRGTQISTNGKLRYKFLRWNAKAHDFARTSHDSCNSPTQALNTTTESKRAVKQLIRYLKGTQHTCLRLEMVQTGLLELVGRSDSDWAGDSATRQSVTGYYYDVQNVTMCNRILKQTAVSLSSCEAEFYAASACARELLGLAELFKELHYKVSVRLEMDSDSARHILQRRGPGGLKHIEI